MLQLMKEYLMLPGNKIKMLIMCIAIIIESIANIRITQLIANVIDNVYELQIAINMLFTLIIYIILQIILEYIITLYSRFGMHKSFSILYNQYVEKLLYSDYSVFTKYSNGQLDEMVSNSIQSISSFGRDILNILKAIISSITTFTAIAMIDIKILIPVLIIYMISLYIISKIWNKISEIERNAKQYKISRSIETQKIISGFAEIRSSCTEKYHSDRIKYLNDKCYYNFTKKGKHVGICNSTFSLIDGLFTIIAIIYAIIAVPKGLSSAVAMTIIMYVWRLLNPMCIILDEIDVFSQYVSSYKTYKEFMDIERKVVDGNIKLTSFNDEISINNIDFQYEDSDSVLSGINLTIKKGEKIGICGPSGGGKSTFLKLIPRFYDPTEGNICIDGIDIRNFTLNSLRAKIGVVHQSNYIFQGTIFDNIKYGSEHATESQVIEAAKKAGIYDFISGLPDKFNTDVGPNGLKLSGGQQQRIAIARIFIANPDIILLDEATSALDNESEQIVQDSLKMFQDKTVITIAHRLSTIDNSDRIVVIDNHKIVEMGTPDELMCNKGLFYKLHNM